MSMKSVAKNSQLQIRVSDAQKRAIRRSATAAGLSISEWLLEKALPSSSAAFKQKCAALGTNTELSLPAADLADYLEALPPSELQVATSEPPDDLTPGLPAGYIASLVEYVCGRKSVRPPKWTSQAPALSTPFFASQLKSLRLHLLTASPAPFRRRNIFVDSSSEARV